MDGTIKRSIATTQAVMIRRVDRLLIPHYRLSKLSATNFAIL